MEVIKQPVLSVAHVYGLQGATLKGLNFIHMRLSRVPCPDQIRQEHSVGAVLTARWLLPAIAIESFRGVVNTANRSDEDLSFDLPRCFCRCRARACQCRPLQSKEGFL